MEAGIGKCGNCGQSLTESAVFSDAIGKTVCRQCHAVERAGWRAWGIGSVVLLCLWALCTLPRWGATGWITVLGKVSLHAMLIWGLGCILVTYRRLGKRARREKRHGARAA